jgi:RHS repeat-associated protein
MKRLNARRISANLFKTCRNVCLPILCCLVVSLAAHGQDAEFTQGHTGGSHAMTLQVPLGNYPGRGMNLPVNLSYSTGGLWRVGFINTIPMGSSVWRSTTEAIYAEHSTAGWTTSLDVPKVEWPKQNDIYWYTGKPYPKGTVSPYTFRIAEVFIHLPDGSTHEFRKSDAVYQDSGVIDMVGTFYAVDGSRMRYDSTGQTTGTLYLADGTRYILNGSSVQLIDANGNTLNFDTNTRQWTDTIGRVIGMPWPVNPGPGDYPYSLPGFNNTTIAYTLKFRSLSAALTPDGQGGPTLRPMGDYYLPNPGANPTGPSGGNFPQPITGAAMFFSGYSDPEETTQSYTYVLGRGQSGSNIFNPTVLAEIVLPNGQSYKFSYNNYGELDKVIFPTGGYQRYQYSSVGAIGVITFPYTQGSRGMISRWISPSGTGTDEAQWQYSTGNTPMVVTAPDGTRTETYAFIGASWTNNFGYEEAKQGLIYEERTYAPVAQGGAMLRRTLTKYGQTSNIINKPNPPNTFNSGTYTAYRNARPEKTVSLILDTGGSYALYSMNTSTYDGTYQFTVGLDLISLSQYNYALVDQTTAQTADITAFTGGPLVRSITMTYFTSNANYRSRNIVGLSDTTTTYNAAGTMVAQSISSYDEAAYPLLPYGSVTGWSDPGTTYRGNLTTTSNWLDYPASVFIQTHAQYDQCGSVRKSWDANGNESQIEYSSAYAFAFPTITRTPVPDSQGQQGSSSPLENTGTFDFNTGLVTSATDENGQITTFEYNDPLLRHTRIVHAFGTGLQNQTTYAYNDPNHLVTTTDDQVSYNDNALKSETLCDGLGRTIETRDYESGSNYIAVQTQYDMFGRAFKVSQPFRPWNSETPIWTTTDFDFLGRAKLVTTPDLAQVTTVYGASLTGVLATTTTVTDQAGKLRRSLSDGLGRLLRIDEPNDAGMLDDQNGPVRSTSYTYNVTDNLTTVSQGGQTRTFVYDSLQRLRSVTTPEGGVVSYSYDATGNMLTRTDARSVVITYAYDGLNRMKSRAYSDGTPTVTFNYDSAAITNGKGRISSVSSSVSSYSYTGYDAMGEVLGNTQTTDGTPYTMNYTYNLAGQITSETYPSGRIVATEYDGAGRIAGVRNQGSSSYYAGGAPTDVANRIDYAAAGAPKRVKLGNGLWEHTDFNARLQITEIGLGTTPGAVDRLKLNYDYGTTNNNGNLISQTITVPTIAGVTGFSAVQTYEYDSLNRLKTAKENNGSSWTQNFTYDRFGNRNFAAGTTFPTSLTASNNPTLSQSNNRLDNTIAGQTAVTYDPAGNLTHDVENRLYTYDGDGRLASFNGGQGVSGGATYYYDPDGRRVKKVVGGSPAVITVYVYNLTGLLLAEYTSASPNQLGTSYISADPLRTPRLITSVDGSVRSRHDYFPFGEEMSGYSGRTSGQGYGAADGLAQKFTQNERENDTFDFLQARYRNFNIGRFISPDPLLFQAGMVLDPQRLNLYVYARNNPLKWLDPDGEKVKIATGSAMEDIYQLVGGMDTFNQFFQIVDGQITLRDGVDISKANEGVKFLAEAIASPETFLIYTGANGDAVARMFSGTTNKDGTLNKKGKDIRDKFEKEGTLTVGTRGRPGVNQPADHEIFAVIAINPAGLKYIQTGVGGYNEYPGGWPEAGAHFTGLGQKVQSVSLLIHELAENLQFSRIGTHPEWSNKVKYQNPKKDGGFSTRWNLYVGGYYHYHRAHNYAVHREVVIRNSVNITGGFGGAPIGTKPGGPLFNR